MKNNLEAHCIGETRLRGIPINLELQLPRLYLCVDSHIQRLLCHSFVFQWLLGECPDMKQRHDKGYPYPKGFTTVCSSRKK